MVGPKTFVLIGLVMLALDGCRWYSSYRIVSKSECVVGYVFEMRKYQGEQAASNESLAPVVQFTTQSGEQARFYSRDYTYPPLYEPGDSVKIWYLPEDPSKATLYDVSHTLFWIYPALFCLLMAGLLYWRPELGAYFTRG